MTAGDSASASRSGAPGRNIARTSRNSDLHQRSIARRPDWLTAGLILGASLFGYAGSAQADVLQISALGFVQHCNPCANPDVEQNGVLLPQNSFFHLFSPVIFPVDGQNVCSFSLVYQDANGAENMRASLKQKQFVVGQSALDTPAFVMATVQSAGSANVVGRKITKAITHPKINSLRSFYYVELEGNVNENVLGVQIDVRPTCPAP